MSQKTAFFDRPEVVSMILNVFYVICVLLVILDFVIHRHIYTSIEKIPAFYALYGCGACVVLVIIANQMRKLLMRGEDFYEPMDKEADIQYPDGFPGHLDHGSDHHSPNKQTESGKGH